MENKLKLENLCFAYPKSKTKALKDFSFDFQKGRAYALLGQNGAGKTTLLRLIAGSLAVSHGQISHPAWALKETLGVLLEQPGFYKHLTAIEYLEFYNSLYPTPIATGEILDLCKELGFEDLNQKCVKLSLGNKQKVQILRCFLNTPKLLLLDEPISHLDPQSQDLFWKFLNTYQKQHQACVILSSHLLLKIPEIMDEILVIKEGQLIEHTLVSELKDQLIPHDFRLRFEELKEEFSLRNVEIELDFNHWFLEKTK